VVGVSQAVEEGQERVGCLVSCGFGVGWAGPGDRSFLLGHVGVEVDVGCRDLLMAQPERDDGDVDAEEQ
jgi:hypothetical protein